MTDELERYAKLFSVGCDFEVHVVDLVMAASRLDTLARQFPTVAKIHYREIESAREQINDTLARINARNWDQKVAAE